MLRMVSFAAADLHDLGLCDKILLQIVARRAEILIWKSGECCVPLHKHLLFLQLLRLL